MTHLPLPPLACPVFDETPHELTTEEVWDNIHMFGDATEAGQANKATEEAAAVAYKI